MKVTGINASPRKNANTMTLVNAVLKGAQDHGAQTRLVNLNELNMKGCQACMACKKDLGNCVQKDDLSPLLQEVKDSDALILGTPIYWFQVSSQFKTFFDRFYCFFGFEMGAEGEIKEVSALPEGKKIVVITSRADQENALYLPEMYPHLNAWLNTMAMSMKPSSVEYIHSYGTHNEKDTARNNTELMAKAAAVGASLVQS